MGINQPEIPGIEEALRDIDEVRKRELGQDALFTVDMLASEVA
jgi:hypothetical protein